jgi:hypothetical protein
MLIAGLACKAIIAVTLLAAGGAKLADLPGFAATVRLFVPRHPAAPAPRAVAIGIAAGEIAVGAASLSSPRAGWLNVVVLAVCLGFLSVSVIGYFRHRGRACHCFGALSVRTFSLAGIARAALLAIAAGVAIGPVRAQVVAVGVAGQLGLLAAAVVLVAATWSAAAALGHADSQARWAS